MAPRISIVVPVFNKQEWIKETLKSIVNQTFTDWECLIVDDGSTDRSTEIISAFIEQSHGEWQLIRQSNQGQSVARNTGIQNTSGKYVAFLDADDLWASNKLEIQMEQLESEPLAICSLSAYQIYDPTKSSRNFRLVQHYSSEKLIHGWLSMRGFGGGIESGGLVLKSALVEAGGFSEQFSTSAGLDLTLRLSLIGKILFANHTCFRYRKYLGQWHTFEGVLIGNLEELRRLEYCKNSKLERKHKAYILFSRFRNSRRNFNLDIDPLELVGLLPALFLLVSSVLLRTLKAMLLGVIKSRKMGKLFI
jgi:glycosyltransferase involved in cell wall biosynthesis